MKNKITGSLAYRMNYGLYVEKFPQGNKDGDAKPNDDGYAVVSKCDPSNINWVSKATFDLIQAAHFKMTGVTR